jgi:RecB family exonuclease
VITPRRTTLFRTPSLAAFRTILVQWILDSTPRAARDTFVLVPTRAAGEQLRRTVEARLARQRASAIPWPVVGTRLDLYEELARRLPSLPPLLTGFEREVLLGAVCRCRVADGVLPPFALRPRLVAEMLALYDQVRRLGRNVDDFDRNLREELEPAQDSDRGAAKLLQQTEFLTSSYRAYEARLDADGALDEHRLRSRLSAEQGPSPLRRIIVTTADRIADPDGLWPADMTLLTRVPGLHTLDIVATEAVLGAGLLERLHAALPGCEEAAGAAAPLQRPVLMTPPSRSDAASLAFAYRDREEELTALARRVKTEHRAAVDVPLSRRGVIVSRPLPYLYLARAVFDDAAVPFEALDTMPLAAEPYAAAVDLVLDAVAKDFTRSALVALFRSPHFDLGAGQNQAGGGGAAALDSALAHARFLGGLDHLETLVDEWAAIDVPASRDERRAVAALAPARTMLQAMRPLSDLAAARRVVDQAAALLRWLQQHDRGGEGAATPAGSRRLRVRNAVWSALASLAEAHQRYDADAIADVVALTATIRRWLESQTFATTSGTAGVQIVDAQAARYGEFDDVQIVGLIDGEWPSLQRRNVLYPSSLLAMLEPLPAVADPHRRERDAVNAARAGFRDLLQSAARTVRVSTFALEHDAVVEPSMLLDEVRACGLTPVAAQDTGVRVSYADALALEPRRPEVMPAPARAWAVSRLAPTRSEQAFRGAAGPWVLPRVSVSRLERYLGCPFRFFAAEVLRLEEQPDDEEGRTPLERGVFLHDLWERFFAEWQQRGHGRIGIDDLSDARSLFTAVCEAALATLSPSEAALERPRLLGSAVDPGIAHRVFAMEANRPVRIVERLLEFQLQGDFVFRRRDGTARTVPLSAKVDRIDLLEDGTLRVIDYKSKNTPDLDAALQLPIYGLCARRRLEGRGGRTWTIGEALYVSFEGAKVEKPLKARGRSLDDLLDDAQERLIDTLENIAAGAFPARPASKSLCGPCAYKTVCRLDFVESTAPEDEA